MESPTTSDNSTATTTATITNNNGNHISKTIKKNIDTDLKTSIIEFMQSRPFLWDSKHLCYKDHKRRDYEFQIFSQKIGHPVQEIKRVWHVLRTNFFRAHKLLMEKPTSSRENGEKLWKYYSAMSYILNVTTNDHNHNYNQDSQNDAARKTRSHKDNNNQIIQRGSRRGSRSLPSTNASTPVKITNISPAMPSHLLDADDNDHLYARSLTLTLKKFDPTTKEVIKLKFQEIIVQYMQQQQQQQPTPPMIAKLHKLDANSDINAGNLAIESHQKEKSFEQSVKTQTVTKTDSAMKQTL